MCVMYCSHTVSVIAIVGPIWSSLTPHVYNSSTSAHVCTCNVLYSCVRLARAGHACEFVRSADLSHFYGLCIISGDGLIHEVRPSDRETHLKNLLTARAPGPHNITCYRGDTCHSHVSFLILYCTVLYIRRLVREREKTTVLFESVLNKFLTNF